jgi:hypothetical protein
MIISIEPAAVCPGSNLRRVRHAGRGVYPPSKRGRAGGTAFA